MNKPTLESIQGELIPKPTLVSGDGEDSNHPQFHNIVDVSQPRTVSQYRFHAAQERDAKIVRVGNDLLGQLEDMHPLAWRAMLAVILKLDPYSPEIMNHEEFLEGLEKQDVRIPTQLRRIDIYADDYTSMNGLSPTYGKIQFALDVDRLCDEYIIEPELENGVPTGRTNRTRISDQVTFGQRVGRSNKLLMVDQKDFVEKQGKPKKAHMCTVRLTNEAARQLFLLGRHFTRFSIQKKMSSAALKLYALMRMEVGQTEKGSDGKPKKNRWFLSWSLAEWNRKLGTSHRSMAVLEKGFRLHTEISDATEFICIWSVDKGRKSATVEFSLESHEAYKLAVSVSSQTQLTAVVDYGEGKPCLNNQPPARPRLPRQTKAAQVVGSTSEHTWAKKCCKLLIQYEKDCLAVDRVFPARDRKTLNERHMIVFGTLYNPDWE